MVEDIRSPKAEMEAGKKEGSHPQLRRAFETSLGHVGLCLETIAIAQQQQQQQQVVCSLYIRLYIKYALF